MNLYSPTPISWGLSSYWVWALWWYPNRQANLLNLAFNLLAAQCPAWSSGIIWRCHSKPWSFRTARKADRRSTTQTEPCRIYQKGLSTVSNPDTTFKAELCFSIPNWLSLWQWDGQQQQTCRPNLSFIKWNVRKYGMSICTFKKE